MPNCFQLTPIGQSFDEIEAKPRETLAKNDEPAFREYWETMLKVLAFVRANYTADTWWEPRSLA